MLQQEGLLAAARWTVDHAVYKIGLKDGPTKRRLKISRRLEEIFGSRVAYGPFEGLKFHKNNWWGTGDRAGMMLGLYEQELLDALSDLKGRYSTFIDLGAADGYYGVGVLVAGLFEKSYCFEISENGRRCIAENASLNGVTDRIVIAGEATPSFYSAVLERDRKNAVLFIDIEGAEFDLLTEECLSAFNKSTIFIELHDWFFDNGDEMLEALKERAARYFTITAITTGKRDLSGFPELRDFSDDDRWLICSEGRAQAMTWLRLDPKN